MAIPKLADQLSEQSDVASRPRCLTEMHLNTSRVVSCTGPAEHRMRSVEAAQKISLELFELFGQSLTLSIHHRRQQLNIHLLTNSLPILHRNDVLVHMVGDKNSHQAGRETVLAEVFEEPQRSISWEVPGAFKIEGQIKNSTQCVILLAEYSMDRRSKVF